MMIFPTTPLQARAMRIIDPARAKITAKKFLQRSGRHRTVAIASPRGAHQNHLTRTVVEERAAVRLQTTSFVLPHRLATDASETTRLLSCKSDTTTTDTTIPTTGRASATLTAADPAGETSTTKTNGDEAAAAPGTAAPEELLRAPFTKTEAARKSGNGSSNKGLFPWVSSPDLPERLVPGTPENYSKGLLLGGSLTSSNPRADGFATACFFLRIPFWDMVFFRSATEQDLADSMAWAFGEAVKEITGGTTGSSNSKSTGNVDEDGVGGGGGNGDNSGKTDNVSPRLREMMETKKLAKLFESATEFGRESLQVKLETTPILYTDRVEGESDNNTGSDGPEREDGGFDAGALPHGLSDGPKIVSLFVFPYLSRNVIEQGDKIRLRKYEKLLDLITASNKDDDDSESSYTQSLELSRDLMDDFSRRRVSENTVICQVLVPCRETFWVKDTATGAILQGDPEPRTVLHLVRFEQTTRTHIDRDGDNNSYSSRFFPFRHELGQWTITDIDDLCDGNLLL